MPMRRSSGGSAKPAVLTISFASLTEPASGCSKPATSRNSVVLPQPEGPREREELTVRDRQRDILDGARRAEPLRHAFQVHACHGTTPSGSLPRSVVASMARPSVSATEIVATAAAAGELPSYCRANTTTPSVSRPVDHNSAETVSSLSALMKISNAPAID